MSCWAELAKTGSAARAQASATRTDTADTDFNGATALGSTKMTPSSESPGDSGQKISAIIEKSTGVFEGFPDPAFDRWNDGPRAELDIDFDI